MLRFLLFFKILRSKKKGGEVIDKKRFKVTDSFREKVEKIFSSEMSGIKKLEILALMLRFYDSMKIRAEGCSKYLKEKIRPLMRDLFIKLGKDEFVFKRTFIKIVEIWNFPSNKEGLKRYQQIVDLVGEEKANSWIEVKTELVPAYTRTFFNISDKGKKEIEKLGLSGKILEILGNTPRVEVGRIPKRVKKGKPRKSSKGSK